jgi:L-amino acid N-acyltransferase
LDVLSSSAVQPMKLIRCDESWSGQILDIFNHAIVTSTALYEYQPRTPEFMATWFENKRRGSFPVVGLVEGEELIGFGSFGSFRPFPGYKYTVEHSVYVSAKHRRRGAGKRLLEEIVRLAREQNYHVLVGVIDSQNEVSINLHKRLGFQLAGTLRQAGFKFGRWLDVDFYQLTLNGPTEPVDG